jgi:mRNA interferase MazF
MGLPLTSRDRRLPTHVQVEPPEGGVRLRSFARCEDLRSVAVTRLVEGLFGRVPARVMAEVEARLELPPGL